MGQHKTTIHNQKNSIEDILLEKELEFISSEIISAKRGCVSCLKDNLNGYYGFAPQRAKKRLKEYANKIQATTIIIKEKIKRQEFDHDNKNYFTILANFYK